MEKHISTPLRKEDLVELKSGDYVYITGTIYSARDATHKRMFETTQEGKKIAVVGIIRKIPRLYPKRGSYSRVHRPDTQSVGLIAAFTAQIPKAWVS